MHIFLIRPLPYFAGCDGGWLEVVDTKGLDVHRILCTGFFFSALSWKVHFLLTATIIWCFTLLNVSHPDVAVSRQVLIAKRLCKFGEDDRVARRVVTLCLHRH